MAIENELINNKYDLVICDFLQSTLNTQDITGVPRLLFQHNVEAQITKRHLTRSKNIISRLFWTLQHKRMYRHEGEMCREFDGTIVVSEEDKRLIKQWYSAKNIYTIPTGVDTDYYLPSYNVKNVYQLVFTGSMDWLPNDDAIFWFISEIYPEIKKKIPQTNLVIVGRNPSKRIEKIIKQYSDITLTGWVEDTRPYISESSVYIVPIRIGGGTRMKIYEALSMGKALVSTTIGAEGLPITNDVHYLLADNETEFINAVVELLRDPDKRDRLGRTARQLVHNNYRWEIVADKFYNICETVISNNRK
jgi:glycosyltransferase involved in cell wall biosynthesis